MNETKRFGATPEEWETFVALAKDDVRPIVCDPSIRPTPNSVIKDPTKIPTLMSRSGQYMGMLGWQSKFPTDVEIAEWAATPQYGISLVGRTYKAIDIDIDIEEDAAEVAEAIYEFFGRKIPTRRRANQARRLMIFSITDAEDMVKKFRLHTLSGVVEFLFDRQQFVVAGTHKSGERHYWEYGTPTADEIPAITMQQLKNLHKFLADEFCNGEAETIGSETNVQVERRDITQVIANDPEYQAVLESPYFRSLLADGKVALFCPWQHLHTSTNGEPDANESAVVYFPKGLGGRKESGFKCMHTSHEEKTIQHFLEAIGYVPTEFEVVELPPEPVMPVLKGASKTSVPPSLPNVVNSLMADDWLGVSLCMDEFTGSVQIRWAHEGNYWRDFKEADYPALTMQLMKKCNMSGVPKERLRDAVIYVSDVNRRDSAIEWLRSLEWDGVPRIEATAVEILGTVDSEYTRAVSRYLWTAMAGRILQPGVKADMVPVLIGAQGVRKSSFVKALAPADYNWHTNLSFDAKDADLARLTRGKMVVELPELRGLNSRDEDHIKAWLTQGEDSWVPKYQENQVTLKRRFIMVATNNYQRFLSDSTGNRRWLPLMVGRTMPFIDTDRLTDNLLQYWAEAKEAFLTHGVQWRQAETLACLEMPKHMRIDPWRDTIAIFLREQLADEISANEISAENVARTCLRIDASRIDMRVQFRIESVFRSLGMTQNDDTGLWTINDLV